MEVEICGRYGKSPVESDLGIIGAAKLAECFKFQNQDNRKIKFGQIARRWISALPETNDRVLANLTFSKEIAAMSEDPSYLRLGFVIAVLGMAGISYWVVQERSQSTALTKNVAEAPAPAMQKPAQNPLPASESSVPDAGASPEAVVENSVPPPEPPAREEKPLDKPTAASPTETPNLQEGPTTESASATTAGQSEEPAAPPLPPQRDIFSHPTQATAPAPPSSSALAAAIPAEDKMNARNRRQVQQALQRLGYYEGPLDELFGPATRSAIRRFQESIGAQATGRLNETEASRLASGH